jgi:hypothetical protein
VSQTPATNPPAVAATSAAPTPTTNPITLTPGEQQFFSEVNQVPTIASAVDDGSTSETAVGQAGGQLCQTLSVDTADGNGGQSLYLAQVSEMTQSGLGLGPAINLNIDTAETVESLAIEDICPTYLSDIPPGDPGAL